MDTGPGTANVSRARGWALAWLAFLCLPAAGQSRLSLAQAAARKPPDYTAVHLDQTVTVRGVVNAAPFHFPGYTVASLEDNAAGGALWVSNGDTRLDALRPGDELEVTGKVMMLAGMAVIAPSSLATVGHHSAPSPAEVPVSGLQNFSVLGRLVRTAGRVLEMGDTSSGEFLTISEGGIRQRVFLPRAGQKSASVASRVSEGDRVRIAGIAYEYSTQPPYDRRFELLVGSPEDVVRLEHDWRPSPLVVLAPLALLIAAAILLWFRERHTKLQRSTLRRTYQLGEDILSSPTPEAASQRIAEALPAILGISRVRLYVHNRGSGTLDEVPGHEGQTVSIPLTSGPETTQVGAAACFHYRTPLQVPDTGRSPFQVVENASGIVPKAQLFVPMATQDGVLGVLQFDQDDRPRAFDTDEQALAQHLANQMAVALKLLDQRSVQEQLFRTEKMAAVGRLISSVVNELQAPLASISDLATRAARSVHEGAAGKDLTAIAAEAQKASAMVARMVSFAAANPGEARPVSIGALLRNLVDFRERDWKASGIKVRDMLTGDPLVVMGSHGQLEQVFLRLLVHAEQSLAAAPEKVLTIRTSLLARMVVVEIVFSARAEAQTTGELASILGVTRSVINGHGGEVRLVEKSAGETRFEVELPLVAKERAVPDAAARERVSTSGRRLTALVIETEESPQRQILGLLASRGYRVVPVNNTDTGLDLAQRMRFDVVFCSVRAPGLNWVELAERMQSKVTGFVLMSDGYDAELAADFEADGRFVLAKPVQDSELQKVLAAIERPIPA